MNKDLTYTSILKEYKSRIYKTCLSYIGDEENAKDVLQDICIIIWEKLETFKNESSISTWIFRISVNTCLMFNRKEKKIEKIPIDSFFQLFDDPSNIELKKLEEIQLKQLYESISKLLEFDKMIIILYLNGFKYEQMSEILGITISNVGVRMKRVREKIKLNIQNENSIELY